MYIEQKKRGQEGVGRMENIKNHYRQNDEERRGDEIWV